MFYGFTNRFYNTDLYCLRLALQNQPVLHVSTVLVAMFQGDMKTYKPMVLITKTKCFQQKCCLKIKTYREKLSNDLLMQFHIS